MTEAIKQTVSTIGELTSARSVQAIITVIVTLSVVYLFSTGQETPENLLFVWFLLLGVYVDVPGKSDSSV